MTYRPDLGMKRLDPSHSIRDQWHAVAEAPSPPYAVHLSAAYCSLTSLFQTSFTPAAEFSIPHQCCCQNSVAFDGESKQGSSRAWQLTAAAGLQGLLFLKVTFSLTCPRSQGRSVPQDEFSASGDLWLVILASWHVSPV